MQPVAPPFDVTPEELEALLEGVRDALGEAGYQKLKAAIRTLGYVPNSLARSLRSHKTRMLALVLTAGPAPPPPG